MNRHLNEIALGWQGQRGLYAPVLSPGPRRVQPVPTALAPQGPLFMGTEALGGSDIQEVWGPMAFPCHFRVFSFHPKEEEVGGGNPKPLCRARQAHGFSVWDPHIKGSICVFTEGHMEVTQMLLGCAVAVTSAAPLPWLAGAGQHWGPQEGPPVLL